MGEDAEEPARHEKITPLPSALANEGPELDEVIDQFVRKLPGLLAAIETAYLAGEYRNVIGLAHNLKGMGGGFGYPQLSERARQIETLCDNGDYRAIAAVIADLHHLARCIRAGRDAEKNR